MGGACSVHGRHEIYIQSFGGELRRRKRPFERHKHRWEDNIKLDPEKQGLKCEIYSNGFEQNPKTGV
jgi:hypothetical protein